MAGWEKPVPGLHLVQVAGVLFEPLREFLVGRRNPAHSTLHLRISHDLGVSQDFLGA